MKGTRFLAFLLAFVLAFSSIGVADVSAAETLSGNQVTEDTLSGNEVKPEDVEVPVEEPVVEEKPVVLEEEIIVQKEAAQVVIDGISGISVQIDVRNVEDDYSWLFNDETLDVNVSVENLPEGATVEAVAGKLDWENQEGNYEYSFTEFAGNDYYAYDEDNRVIRLYGAKIVPALMNENVEEFGVRVIVRDSEGNEIFSKNPTWLFYARNAWIGYDYPCSFPGNNVMLCKDDSIHIDKYMYSYGENSENPYGKEADVEITSLSVDGNDDIIGVEDQGENGWELIANGQGYADVTIKFYDWFHGEEEQDYTFQVYADGIKGELFLEYPNDNNMLLRGQEKVIPTSLKFRYIDDDGNHQEEWIDDYTLSFVVYEEGKEPELVQSFAGEYVSFTTDGKTINAKASDERYGWDNVDIKVNYTFHDKEFECDSRIDMGVTGTYFSIDTIKDVNNVEVGDTIDMDDYINVYQYKEGWEEPLNVTTKGDDYTLNDRDHRIRIYWDENVWEPIREDELVPELRRISPEHGWITVVPQCTEKMDENGNIPDEWSDYGGFERRFEFYGLDYNVWMEDLPGGDRHWLFADENLTYKFNIDNLQDKDNAEFIVRAAYSEEGSETPTPFGDDLYSFDATNGTLTLYGEKIREYLPENHGDFCLFYSVAVEKDGEIYVLCEGNRDIELREPWGDYDLPNEWVELLLGDEQFINRRMGVYYEDKENPHGNWTEVEITDIEVLRHREYYEDGSRATAKSIVFLSENEDGWHIYGEDHGETDFKLTYYDVYGEKQEHYFTASSAGDQILLQLDTPDDYIRMLPNSEECYEVEVVRRYTDLKDNQHQETLSANNISFRIDEENTAATKDDYLASYSVSGNNLIVIKTKEDVSGDSWFDVNATISYIDIYGNEQEQVIGRGYRLEVNDEVYSLELKNPDAIKSFVNIEEQLDLSTAEPVVKVQRKGEQERTLSPEEVYFAVENWDTNAWVEIPREDGEENEIILLERTGTWKTNLNLVARWRETEDEIGRYSFEFAGTETWFRHLRGGGHTWVYTDETGYTIDLDMNNFAGVSDVNVEWLVGEVDENNNFIEERLAAGTKISGADEDEIHSLIESYHYVIDEDTTSIRLNGEKLVEDFRTEDNSGVTVRAIIRSGDKVLYQFDTWVEIKDSICRLEGEDSSELLYWEGTGWVYEQNTIDAWVENEHFPYGKNVTLYIEDMALENHDSENPAFTLYSHRASGYWNIYAEQPGGATVTFRLHHGYMGSFEISKDIYASDEMYYFQVFPEKGTNVILPGEPLKLITDLYKYTVDENGKVEETYIGEYEDISIWTNDNSLLRCDSSDKTVKAKVDASGGANVFVRVDFRREDGSMDWREYPLWVEVSEHIMTLTSEDYYVEPGTIHDIDKFDLRIVESYFEDGEKVEKVYEAEKARFQNVGNYNYFWITWWNQKIAVNNKINRSLPLSNKVYVVAEHDGQQFEGWVNVVICEHDYQKMTMSGSDDSTTTYDYCAKCQHVKNYKTFALSKTSYTFNGSVQKPSVVVLDKDGKTLDSKYYSVSYPSGCKNAGTYKVTISFKGEYSGSETLSYSIGAKKITPTVTLSKTEFTYNKKEQTPTVTVKDGFTKLTANTDYTVSYSSGRKNVGKYTVTVTLKGNYSGTKSVTYKINPKGTSISKLTAASKAFTVKWKKQATQTTGYQIQYSTSKDFSGAKTVNVKGTSTVSKAVKKLKAKKKYYVRVCTYKTVSGVTYYSSWSSAKSIKTK